MSGARFERDMDDEMRAHVAMAADELVRQGVPPDEARRRALVDFGGIERFKEVSRDQRRGAWLDGLLADLRYAMRSLRTHPGFTLVAVFSLGLGIGANSAIFSLINALMLRPLPVPHPEELVEVTRGEDNGVFTNPLWEQIRDRPHLFAGSVAFGGATLNLTTGGVVRNAAAAYVSGGYFNVLGVTAVAGRVVVPGDDVPGCSGVAVLSHGFWRREYGGDAGVVGRTINLSGHPFIIVGVSAAGFSGILVGRDVDVFIPLCTKSFVEGPQMLQARGLFDLQVFGRLKPGGTLSEARVALAAASPGVFEATVPPRWTAQAQREFLDGTLSARHATTGVSRVRGQYREALFILLMVVGVVLLIASANVAQLLLARATARQHEMAVRLALGCGRWRLVRQLLTESLLLAFLGAAVGLLFAQWSSGVIVGSLSQTGRAAVWLDLTLDLRVLGFTILVTIATAMIFGLAPTWRSSRVDPQGSMRGAGRGFVGDTRLRLARGIVMGQVALSLVLVTAAGLLVGTFRRLATLDPGFERERVLLVRAGWSNLHLAEPRQHSFHRELLDAVRGLAGVRHASGSVLIPIGGSALNESVTVDGFTPQDPRDALVWFNRVTDGFFETLGTGLLAGRDFTPQDAAGAPRVVIVNETLARRFFGPANALGRQVRVNDDDWGGPMEIVGVVEDARYRTLNEDILPTAYVPLDQTGSDGASVRLAMRTEGPPSGWIPVVTEAMRQLHPAIALEFTTLREQVGRSLARPRLLGVLSGFFGALALLLAIIGLYGTISYGVARRRREIGVRIALGAAPGGILRMVAGEAAIVMGVGLVLGAVLVLAATRLVAAFLYGVTPTDPVTLALSALILAAVGMCAGLVPAWRAAGIDPMVVLRDE